MAFLVLAARSDHFTGTGKAHRVTSSADFRSVDAAAEAVANLGEDLFTPGRALQATLGQAQQKIDADLRMEDVRVEEGDVGQDPKGPGACRVDYPSAPPPSQNVMTPRGLCTGSA